MYTRTIPGAGFPVSPLKVGVEKLALAPVVAMELGMFSAGHRCRPISRPYQHAGGLVKHRGNDGTRTIPEGAGR